MTDKPITPERVAAAFEAWWQAWITGGDLEGQNPHRLMDETWSDYAQRLAAGLFKYLERQS